MSKPTQKDAELMIRLTTLGQSPEMKEAWNWVLELEEPNYEDFIKENPVGSDGWKHFISIAGFLELTGVLVKYGTINEDIVLDFYYTAWDKLGPIVKGFQKDRKSPRWFENYEYLAKRKAEWLKEHPPVFQQ